MMRALTLVVAPAGFGKTTLLTAWARSNQHQVAWLSLDATDQKPERFLTYLIQALQQISPNIGQTSLALLYSGQGISREGTLYSLVNDLADTFGNIMLILDDYHLVDYPQISQITQFLLEHRPNNFHIALATRTKPSLSLVRLRARNQVVEINADDLRFTDSEILTFVEESMRLKLRATDLERLVRSTEGWAVGLQLAALALTREATDWEIPAGQTQIFNYLAEEVLRREPVNVRDFLLRISLIDRFCVPLCEVLLDEKRPNETPVPELLAYVERANLFLFPLDATGTWYRLHALFADFLRQKFESASPAQIPELYRKASRWFENQGILDEAVHYAIHAQDFDRAADLLESHYRMIVQNSQQISDLHAWLSDIPSSFMDEHPVLWLIKGWASIVSLDTVQARVCTDQFERLVPLDEMADIQQGELKSLRTLTDIFVGNIFTADEVSEISKSLSEQDGFLYLVLHLNLGMLSFLASENKQAIDAFSKIQDSPLLRENPLILTMAYSHKAEAHTFRGEFAAAEDTFQQVFRYIQENFGRKSFLLGIPYIGYADLLRELNRLEDAQNYADLGIAANKLWNPTAGLYGHIVLARIKATQGNWEQAYTLLETTIKIAQTSETIIDDIHAIIHFVRLKLLQGELSQAVYWAKRYNIQARSSQMPYSMQELAQLLWFRTQVFSAGSDPRGSDQAAQDLVPLIEESKRRGNKTVAIIALILHTYASYQARKPKNAVQSLQEALALGAESGYVRIFADEGSRLLGLFKLYRSQLSDVDPYLEMLLSIMENEKPAASQLALSPDDLIPLTRRELDILYQMSTGKSNQEIADELVLALNTVKKHVANVLSKLGVSNRTQAVMIAKKRGWLNEK
jgi:LuxR family maltose regulon positive regulatory protein